MRKIALLLLTITLFSAPKKASAQVDPDVLGAWYMYFYKAQFGKSSFGIQGDIQYRNWNLGGDLEQLLLRSGFTYRPKNAKVLFTLGYGHITTGAFGSSNSTTMESRIYQEALFPTKLGKRFYFNHRLRYEQRFVDNQNFRTRYRYNLFLNVPLNNSEIVKNTVYIALYDELFINGERNIGNGQDVQIFDRNRFYAAVGFAIKKNMKVQLGMMNQATNSWKKNQLQVSFHQSF